MHFVFTSLKTGISCYLLAPFWGMERQDQGTEIGQELLMVTLKV